MEISTEGVLWRFEKLRQNQPLSEKLNDQPGKEYKIVASDIMSEEHTRDNYSEPDFLRFKAEIKPNIKNIRSHLFFLKLLGEKGIDLFWGPGGDSIMAEWEGVLCLSE